MANSPNVLNYFVGKGTVSFKRTGHGSYRDLGNVPEFEFTPSIDKLDHFSSRSGVKSKDRSIVITRSATIRIVMDELTPENLALVLMGDADESTSGDTHIAIMSISEITGSILFAGTNDVGNQVDIELPNVSFTPTSSFSPISDEWGQLEITGEVTAAQDGSFGTAVVREANSSA